MQKQRKQYFTRKNFIALSLVCFFSILLVFVALCLDKSPLSSFIKQDNPFAVLSQKLGFAGVEAGVYGLVNVALVAIYSVVYAAAVIFLGRLAVVNGKSPYSLKSLAAYFAAFVLCVALSVGLGLLLQPQISVQNVLTHLNFLAQCLAVTAIIYSVIFILVSSVLMFIVNFTKVGKPFEFFSDPLAEIAEEEDSRVESNFNANPSFSDVTTASSAQILPSASVTAEAGAAEVLGDRKFVFPTLSSVDSKYGGMQAPALPKAQVTLNQLCQGFRNYLAKEEKLYYDIDVVRLFISGLSASRLIILQGLSGTGKSSLPRYFCKYVQGRATFLPVQATWRDRTNLLGYFNDFSKTYSETDFLAALYEAGYDYDRINLFVLDELNVARVEYYFADFLSVLEYPAEEWKLRIMHFPSDFVPPVKLTQGFIQIPQNCYFVGTANKDDSTFTIADKVYDRAITIDFDNRNLPFQPEEEVAPIALGSSQLSKMFKQAEEVEQNNLSAEDLQKFNVITDYVYDSFGAALGNRVLHQMGVLTPVFVACGGAKEGVLDFILSGKLLAKLQGKFGQQVKSKLNGLSNLLTQVYGGGAFPKSRRAISALISSL